jgi:hypothetical protein
MLQTLETMGGEETDEKIPRIQRCGSRGYGRESNYRYERLVKISTTYPIWEKGSGFSWGYGRFLSAIVQAAW